MQDKSTERVAPWRVLLSVVISVGAMLLQWHFWDFFTPFVGALSYPALLVSVMVGGIWGGLISTAIWTAVIYCVFMAPELSLALENPRNLVAIVVFIILGTTFSIVDDRIRRYRSQLTGALISDVEEAQSAVIVALARLAESRDGSTGRHLEAVRTLCLRLAQVLQGDPNFKEPISDEFVESLQQSCVLHDIGKVGIPDDILLKPSRLNDREFNIIKQHANIGAELLEDILATHPGNQLLETAVAIARSHHERWDGRGYPQGLSGIDIPLAARIMAVADVYEALRSQRCYKDAIDHDAAVSLILEGEGAQFDPDVVRAFVTCADELRSVWQDAGESDFLAPVAVAYREPESIKRALRDLEAIRLTDRALIESTDESDFAQRVCEICVSVAGYSLAWVGRPTSDAKKSIKPIAWAGEMSGYLAEVDIRWSDAPEGSGPVGTAVKTGRPVVVRSTDKDELFAPWRDRALDMDLRSVVSLPLLGPDESALGVLTVYSNHENAFDGGELQLLTEISDDLAFGFNSLANRTQADRYHALWMSARDAVLFVNPEDGAIIEANRAAEKLYGATRDELVVRTIHDLRSPVARADVANHLAAAASEGVLFETEHVRPDGTVFPVEVSSGPVQIGSDLALVSVVRDITNRVETRKALEESEAQLRLITDMIADVVVRFDEGGTITWASPSLTTALGWRPSEWNGARLEEFLHPEDARDVEGMFGETALPEEGFSRHRIRGSRGEYHWVEVNITLAISSDGKMTGAIASFRVVDSQVAAEKELEHRAHYDHLTGVFNRGAILAQADHIVAGHRRSGEEVALMFCDVDNLRDVNEEFGHAGGDAMLNAVAQRICAAVRTDDVVGRIGGDEFLVVLRGIQDIESAVMVAEKVRVAVSEPLESDGLRMEPSASIGVTLAGNQDETHAIIDRADRGLLCAKSQGKDKVIVVNDTEDGYECVC